MGTAVDPLTEVLAFFEEWRPSLDAMSAALAKRFTDRTVWENVGISKTVGHAEATAFMDGFARMYPIGTCEVIVHHAAASGNAVLTERTDNFYDEDGKLVLSIPLMGVFEMDGPRIAAWRDYFDTAKGFS